MGMSEVEAVSVRSGPMVRVIGQVAVLVDEQEVVLQPGQRQLLSLLVAVGPSGASRDRLADEIWGENLPEKWRNSLRVAVHRLRKRSGLRVVFDGGIYRIEADPTAVDAWHLRQVVEQDLAWEPAFESFLAGTESFASVEMSPSVVVSSAQILNDQRHLIERLAEECRSEPRRLLARLGTHMRAAPLDERLIDAVVRIHRNSGAGGQAVHLIEHCRRDRLESYGVEVCADLDRIEESLRLGLTDELSQQPDTGPPPVPRRIERHRSDHLVGRTETLAGLRDRIASSDGSVTIVGGQAGVGKTAVVAELAVELSGVAHVEYLTGIGPGRIGLAPLTTAIPELAPAVQAEPNPGDDRSGRLQRLARELLSVLDHRSGGRLVLLIVDDAHWLDSQTCELLDYLVRAKLGQGRLRGIVLAARPVSDGPSPWLDLEASLARLAPVIEVTLEPLDAAGIYDLLSHLEPGLPLLSRYQKARWLHRRSAGLPEVAKRIVELGEAESFESPEGALVGNPTGSQPDGQRVETLRVFDRVVQSVESEVRQVGMAAAVLGRRFRLSDLASLLDRPADELFDLVDSLVDRRLVVETGSFDHFEFSHQLLVDAFDRSVSRGRRARLHLRAAELWPDDVHGLARHRLAAGTFCERALTVEAVLASAEAYLANGDFWESAAEFRDAVALVGEDLSPESFVSYARALALSGVRRGSRALRERAFAAAVAARRWDLALEAACSGLPEAESPDGERDRFDQLERIPHDALDPEDRFVHALTATRQAALLGLVDDAEEWAARAAVEARSDEHRAEAALGRWFAQLSSEPAHRRQVDLERATIGLGLSDPHRCRVEQASAINRLELGDLVGSAAHADRFGRLARASGDRWREWHAQVFACLVDEVEGRFEAADRAADAAQATGRVLGVPYADVVRVSQRFFRLQATGQLALLVDLVGSMPEPDAGSQLVTAASSQVLDAAGRRSEAVDMAIELLHRQTRHPSATSHSTVALLAPVLAHHRSSDERRKAMAILEPFRGGSLVVGIGVGVVASIDALSILLDRGAETGTQPALKQAIADSDRAGLTTWSVRYRLDLAGLTGSSSLVEEAAAVASCSPELTALLPGDLAA